MSEIKVNKISPRAACGTVTLGDSGDTFTIPAGATINNQGTATNFGATGSASWTTTVKTSTFTAVAGEGYFCNTTSGGFTVNLPAGTAGAVVAVKDYANTFDTGNLVISANGSEKIGGSTNDATLSTEGLAATFIYIDSTKGWLVTDDGLQSVASTNPYMVATVSGSGNCLSTAPDCANMKVATFTGPGTFEVTKAAVCATDNIVSYVVIAGGGAGGGGDGGGGGGAGGYRELVSPSSPYTGSPLNGYPSAPNRVTVGIAAYPIVVGGGGTAANCGTVPGSNSTFSTIISAGGGGGGGPHNTPGANGGSGGGGTGRSGAAGGSGNTPPVSPSQGNDGSSSTPSPSNPDRGGGGGGAGTTGFSTTANAGAGGNGVTSEINGTPTARGGGGGGGKDADTPNGGTSGNGGTGGGGNGSSQDGSPRCAAAGTDNTGGGGGGQGNSPKPSKNGGSGIVIIRYRFQ